MSNQIVTHYVPYFTEPHRDRSLRTAVCGQLIRMSEHAVQPSCARCEAWIEADNKEAKTLAAKWDREDAAKRAAAQGVSR